MNRPAQPVRHRDLSRPRQRAPLERLIHCSVEEVHEVPKSLSAPIVLDLYPTAIDPLPTYRGKSIDRRAWRREARQRLVFDQS